MYIDPLLKDKRRSQREKKKGNLLDKERGPPPVHMLVLNKMKKDNINNRRTKKESPSRRRLILCVSKHELFQCVFIYTHIYTHIYIYAGLFPRLLFFLSPVVCVCVFFKDFERKRRPLSIIANRVSCCTSRLMAKKSGCQYRVSKPRKDLCGRRLVFSKFTFGFSSQRSRIFPTVNRYKLEHSKSLSLSC